MASSKRRAPADPEEAVRDFLKSRLSPGARLCVGYSGGLDSSVLLHLLAGLRHEFGFSLAAVHVHHGLSPHADAWAAHCRLTCARLDVHLAVHRVEVVAGPLGIEAAARSARYRVFAGLDADAVVLAHHRDDQAETLLFRLLRGAGVHGLAAMAESREIAGRTVWRPLLPCGRDSLAGYARERVIAHVEDESNAEEAWTRNWLRHAVFPVLDARFPACRQVFARTAEQLSESAELLDALAIADLETAFAGNGLELVVLARLGPARARNLLRYWLKRETGVVPARAGLVEMLEQLLTAAPDRHPAMPVGDSLLERRGGRAVLVGRVPALPRGEWHWQGQPILDLGDAGRLCFSLTEGAGLAVAQVPDAGGRVVWRAGGERLRPDCRRPARTLKNLLREAGVPAGERSRWPLLYFGDRLAWVAGVGVDCGFQARPGEPGWLISWYPPDR